MYKMYEAFSHPPNPDWGTEPRTSIYRQVPSPENGLVKVLAPFSGIVKREGEYVKTDELDIAYTTWGDKGPVILFLHGVPTNRRQWRPVQERLAPFFRTAAIDMLGLGESDHPLEYGRDDDVERVAQGMGLPSADPNSPYQPWDWVFDIDIVDQVMQSLFPEEKFIFVADDWGSGINSHYAAKYGSTRLLAQVQLDPITLDGYPVSEIQAIGRASMIKDEKQFRMAMGAIDQTMVQIFKTMVHKPDNVYNQYSLRTIKFPYIDVDYERNAYFDGEDATSLTLRLKWDAIRVLADRSAILSPALLLPQDDRLNPKGVKYENIDVPVAILWGEKDNMMPANQRNRLIYAHKNTIVFPVVIGEAGHFAATDQPDRVAEAIITFVIAVLGKDALADIYLGLDGIWKGDEAELIEDLRKIYL
jgi:pimeloyl-ACP methyl ester carboxylesterase